MKNCCSKFGKHSLRYETVSPNDRRTFGLQILVQIMRAGSTRTTVQYLSISPGGLRPIIQFFSQYLFCTVSVFSLFSVTLKFLSQNFFGTSNMNGCFTIQSTRFSSAVLSGSFGAAVFGGASRVRNLGLRVRINWMISFRLKSALRRTLHALRICEWGAYAEMWPERF